MTHGNPKTIKHKLWGRIYKQHQTTIIVPFWRPQWVNGTPYSLHNGRKTEFLGAFLWCSSCGIYLISETNPTVCWAGWGSYLLRSWTNTYQHPLWWLCITFHGVYRPRSRTQATQVSTLMETKCEQGHFKGAPHCHKQPNIHYAMWSSLKMGSHQSLQTVQICSSWLWAVWGVKFGDAGSIHNDSYCHVSTTASGKQILSPVKFHNSIDHLAKARRSVRRL